MKKTKIKKNLFRSLLWMGRIFLIFILLGLLIGTGVTLYYLRNLPRPEDFTESQFNQPTKIYDRTGTVLLYTIVGEENRTVVPLAEISPYLQEAVITAEDRQFYQHPGLNLRGLARAVLVDFRLREPAQGGSTITQQLIRSYFLSSKKTIERKTEEIILSLELERRYEKEQILEWYLNQVPFGSNFYGAEMASQGYFQKPAKELSLNEAATLAALIQAPSYLSPHGSHLDELYARKDYILREMARLGYISSEEKEAALEEELVFSDWSYILKAPHFTLNVIKELEDTYGLESLQRNGWKVYTSLDWELQEKAEKVIQEGVARNALYNVYNGALVALDPQTGEVLALIGSKDYFASESFPAGCLVETNECLFTPQFDVAHLGLRHPGSSLKPFIYATAFEKGYSAQDVVIDEKTNFGNWGGKDYIPRNYDGRFRGAVTLQQALAQSLNVPSVKILLYSAGIEESLSTLKEAGITSSLPAVPSLVLGGGAVKLIELTTAYGIFATEGEKVSPIDILKIEDNRSQIIYQAQVAKERKQIISRQTAQTITGILSSEEARAPMFGYRSNLYIPGYQVAVKTGTNDNYQDFWTIGYTSDIIVGVWLGNNNQAEMAKVPAVTTAGWVWNKFMTEILPLLK
jgi:membrane peptidoglycan carboxypeptidase